MLRRHIRLAGNRGEGRGRLSVAAAPGPGRRGHDGSVVIVLGGDPGRYADLFRRVEVAGRLDAPYAMPYEADMQIFVLRDVKTPLAAYWPKVKSYR